MSTIKDKERTRSLSSPVQAAESARRRHCYWLSAGRRWCWAPVGSIGFATSPIALPRRSDHVHGHARMLGAERTCRNS